VTESTKIAGTTAGTDRLSGSVVLGMLRIAMILGLPLLVSCRTKVEVPQGGQGGGGGADDSPVTVRGGSVTLRDQQGFICPTNPSQPCSATTDQLSVSDKSVIMLDAVQLGKTNPPFTLTPKTNWALKLTFRDGGGAEDPKHYLEVCSAPKCSTHGALAAGPLYLMADDPDDNTGSAWGPPDIDPSTGATFHLTKCGGTAVSGESPCNHIYNVVYTLNGTPTSYSCKYGQCDIGIGKRPSN